MFQQAMDFLFSAEGGYGNDTADRGGETKFGISDNRDGLADGLTDVDGNGKPDTAIKQLTKQQAEKIYYRDYWLSAGCDEIAVAAPKLAIVLMDAAVNHGVGTAKRLLQRAAKVKEDGVIGPKTIGVIALRGDVLAGVMLDVRESYYRDIVENNAAQGRFFRGWMKRLSDLSHFILSVQVGA
ncbi:glycosyl hydrolase 108 family protein [uncultured Tolumonas sp.]|uniref:glycoside hydrolase family 108 protein n=1 Tax=uncultured Tolumonas sp. TaxID=263765 RepID=UPI002A0A797A|nr:glycosyl hydrolase 108 family protein [uncultured Tolumonas sp.]